MESDNPDTLDEVELLFMQLGNPCTTKVCTDVHLRISDSAYNRALRVFLDRTENSDEGDHPDIPFLRAIAVEALTGFNDHGLRIAFIEHLGPLLLDDAEPHWGSHQRRYLSLCRWIFQGRQVDKLQASASNAPRSTPIGHYYHLPKELTIPQNCAQCGKSPARLSCGRCLLRHGSHITICTTYCDRKCQVRHWPRHRPKCLDRVRFIRSVGLMKAIFTMIIEELTMLTPWDCIERNGMTILDENSRIFDYLRGNPLLHKFPRDLFQTERHATMALQSQYAPYLRLRGMIQPLLHWLWGGEFGYMLSTTCSADILQIFACPSRKFPFW